ncbi:MAG: FAD-dependent oxidoreductase [Bifidobacteriaceae bacterium]|jgi:hypothetical protein|nr:FAD-dependent oxidoreductase [Bifidobacteriaceae bacterium]
MTGSAETEIRADLLIVGGGLGGVAAALSASRRGLTVVLANPGEWLGGQLTSQGVPLDEHPWIESFGATASYRALREGIRDHYRRHYQLIEAARRWTELNPGAGTVSKLCCEPRVALTVIDNMLAPWESSRQLTVLRNCEPTAAEVDRDRVRAVVLRDSAGTTTQCRADYVIDASETGELLPLTGTEYVTGAESRDETGEEHAPGAADPLNMQAVSHCFAVDHIAGGDFTIPRPANYDQWRRFRLPGWTTPLFSWTSPSPRTMRPVQRRFCPNPDTDPLEIVADQSLSSGDEDLWIFRRLLARKLFRPGLYASDIVLVNWPGVDYVGLPVFEVPDDQADRARREAREQSLALLHWLQTEAPRPDGGVGFPGLRPRGDVMGTTDGLARELYIRESRRIRALTTVKEQDVSFAARGHSGARAFRDSVGIGSYHIDLHPSTGGDTYIDLASAPFEIPLGALLPRRTRNLIAGAKNIGTTHITNGCYRLHPVEWNVGESAGLLAAFCIAAETEPHAVWERPALLEDFQRVLSAEGIQLAWPRVGPY